MGLAGWLPIITTGVAAFASVLAALLAKDAAPREIRSIVRLSEALGSLPAESASAKQLDLSLSKTVADYEARISVRRGRQLNKVNVGLSVVLALLGIGLVYGSTVLAVFWSSLNPVAGTAGWTLVVLLGLFFALLFAASLGTFYNPKAEPRPRRARK